MSTNFKLLPCPFCGSNDLCGPVLVEYVEDQYDPKCYISCDACFIEMHCPGNSRRLVVDKWNTRMNVIDEYKEFLEWKKEKEELVRKSGNYWLTFEGRKEIRDTWSDPDDGNVVLPLLNELERLESLIKDLGKQLFKEEKT